MKSPLEDNPKLLEKIGLFIVLFNLIDTRLSTEFYFIINQNDVQKRPILDFLVSQDFQKKLDALKLILENALYTKVNKINEFRNFIAHGTYGVKADASEEVSMTKLKRNTHKYHSIPLSEALINKQIESEREVLNEFHKLILKRLPQTKKDEK